MCGQASSKVKVAVAPVILSHCEYFHPDDAAHRASAAGSLTKLYDTRQCENLSHAFRDPSTVQNNLAYRTEWTFV